MIDYISVRTFILLQGQSLLHLIASLGNAQLWTLALSRPEVSLNAQDSVGNSPLMTAALCGHDNLVKEAMTGSEEVRAKADLTLKNSEGDTLLLLAIQFLKEETVQKLISMNTCFPISLATNTISR